jgi:uncharacterized protein (TIGR00369 family)
MWFTNYVRYVGLNNVLKIELLDVSLSNKTVTTQMRVEDIHMAATGLVHGGSIATLADTSIGFGCYVFAPETSSGIAVTNTSIQYLSSARPGDVLLSRASLVHCGHSTQVWDARVSSKTTNKTLAVVQSSALNKYAKEDKQNSASNTNNNNNNAAPRGDSRQWMDLKMNKIGTNFNIDTMSKQEIAAKFDKHAPHWQDLVHKFHYKMLDWVTQQAKTYANKNAVILDAACAVGLISDSLRKGGMTGPMTGIDLSPKMVELAQQRGNYSQTFVHDLEASVPCPDRSFDLITCTGALELVPNPTIFLRETARLLRDDRSEAWLTFQYRYDDGYNPCGHQNVRAYSRPEIEDMLSGAGLEAVFVEVIDDCYRMPSPLMTGALLPVPFIALRVKRRK